MDKAQRKWDLGRWRMYSVQSNISSSSTAIYGKELTEKYENTAEQPLIF
jgi:hypothetical protein